MISSFSRKCSLGAIFVSYRRSDSQGEAGRLFDDLVKHFGERMVFMDVAGIEAGRDFRKAIEESVAQCGALLVVMGPEWLNAKDESGARRLDDPADFVRIETGSALRRDIPVIPVLVHGASMPRPEQLPEGIKDLAYRNCIELTHARWKSDIQLLVEALRRVVVDTRQHEARAEPHQSTGSAQRGIPSEEVRETSKLEHGSSAQIDPVAMQRVSRELALHIGPIADIMVKRAASRCTSIEDLYLKVSEEIESRDERDNFLRRRGLISSAQLPAGRETITLPTSASGTSASIPPSGNPVGPAAVPAATKTRPSSTSKYSLLVGGAFVILILVFFLVTRFAPQRGMNSSPNAQTSTPNPHPAEYTPADSSARPPVVESSLSGDAARGAPDGSIENRNGEMTAAASKVADQPRVRISENVSTGLLISKVLPVYPLTARQARVQGTVVLQAAISKDGTVEALRVASGHPFLIPPAIEAVKQWRYKPYIVNGRPRPVETEVMVNFVLKNQ
jgi:TonB family protein